MAEMVKKMGERILVTILPILEERLDSDNVRLRRGVALALNEIIVNMHRDVVEMYASQIAPPIRKCLLDPEQSVRDAVAQAFGTFHNVTIFVLIAFVDKLFVVVVFADCRLCRQRRDRQPDARGILDDERYEHPGRPLRNYF